VSNTNSYLSQQADFVINATIAAEACPHNLAPTTSTTVHLALGDALAVCLLELRDFSTKDFAEYHPGGSLGKQLYLKVSDIYLQHKLPAVSADTSLKDVIIEISGKRLGCTSVLDRNKNLLGIITDGDLRRMLQKTTQLDHVTAQDIMSLNPKTIDKDEFAVKALHLMQQGNITQLVVMDGQSVAGFIHLHDLLKEGIV
jgi:arabinose-5-phosphate isomerase